MDLDTPIQMDSEGNSSSDQETIFSIAHNSPTSVDACARFRLLYLSSNSVDGDLHGETCTLDEYFDIPREFGDYDYIEGRLESRQMADADHCAIQQTLSAMFNSRKADPSIDTLSGLQIHLEVSVAVSDGRNYRRPDITIGNFRRSGRCGYPAGNPPEFALEITSGSNRGTDVGAKVGEYAGAGIREYWILDRQSRKLRCYKLRARLSSYSQPIVHSYSKRVTSKYFGSFTAEELLNTRDAEQVIANSRVARTQEVQSRRQAEESRRHAAESRARARSREARLHQALELAGVATSISSPSASPPVSPSNSPPRTRRRTRDQ